MMGKYLEYLKDVDLNMVVDHCLWLNEEGLKKLGEYMEMYFGNKTEHCIIVHRNWNSLFTGKMVRISDGLRYEPELRKWYSSNLYVVEIRIYFLDIVLRVGNCDGFTSYYMDYHSREYWDYDIDCRICDFLSAILGEIEWIHNRWLKLLKDKS